MYYNKFIVAYYRFLVNKSYKASKVAVTSTVCHGLYFLSETLCL